MNNAKTTTTIRKALAEAGIARHCKVERTRYGLEVEIYADVGDHLDNLEETEAVTDRALAALGGGWGGYRAGTGAWVLRPEYALSGDYCDPASPHHY